jgi:hypothetical protein
LTGKCRSFSCLEDFDAPLQHLIVQQIGHYGEFSLSILLLGGRSACSPSNPLRDAASTEAKYA